MRICREVSKRCVEDIELALNDPTTTMYKSCDCLDDCNSISYSIMEISDKLSANHLKNFTSNGDFALESEISVYFGASEYQGYKRCTYFETGSFFAKIGATLWLFLGASLLSMVEIFNFVTLRFFNNLWIRD